MFFIVVVSYKKIPSQMISLVFSKFMKTEIVSEHYRIDVGVAFDSASCRTNSRVVYKTAVLRCKAKFVRKHLQWNFFFLIKLQILFFRLAF